MRQIQSSQCVDGPIYRSSLQDAWQGKLIQAEQSRADVVRPLDQTLSIHLLVQGCPNCRLSGSRAALIDRRRDAGASRQWVSRNSWDHQLTRAKVLPISQVSSVASCIHHIACHLPLEKALNLSPPARWQEERERRDAIQSRITTRRQDDEQDVEGSHVAYRKHDDSLHDLHEQWTAGDILQGWAEYRGYGKRELYISNRTDALPSHCQGRSTRHEPSGKREYVHSHGSEVHLIGIASPPDSCRGQNTLALPPEYPRRQLECAKFRRRSQRDLAAGCSGIASGSDSKCRRR